MNSWEVSAHELLVHQAQAFADILRDINPDQLHDDYKTGTGGDERTLRGIPAIGRSVAGAIPGTSPHLRNIR